MIGSCTTCSPTSTGPSDMPDVAEIERRVSDRFDNWESVVCGGEESVRAALNDVQPLVAHGVLRSFVDAYRVVASVLATAGADAITDKPAFLAQCLKTGKQEQLQGRVFSAESISKSLYGTGLKLAEYRGLLAANQADARHQLQQECRRVIKRLDEILAITLAKAEDR